MKDKTKKIETKRKAHEKCLAWFYAFPNTKIGLTELSKSIKTSKTATKEAVEDLTKKEFLQKEIIGKSWLISTNQKHKYSTTKKIPYNLEKIYESEILDKIHKTIPQARAISLFGSYRWGDDTEESDIDIAIEVLDNKQIEISKLCTIKYLGYRKNIQVNIHTFSRNKIDLNLFSNIANGIILEGFLEVKP
ncbi:MAG: nucleotidyltransferase domain-containing protein [Nanoarchaeota archaeon]